MMANYDYTIFRVAGSFVARIIRRRFGHAPAVANESRAYFDRALAEAWALSALSQCASSRRQSVSKKRSFWKQSARFERLNDWMAGQSSRVLANVVTENSWRSKAARQALEARCNTLWMEIYSRCASSGLGDAEAMRFANRLIGAAWPHRFSRALCGEIDLAANWIADSSSKTNYTSID